MITILINTAFRGAALIKGNVLISIWIPKGASLFKRAALIWGLVLIRENTKFPGENLKSEYHNRAISRIWMQLPFFANALFWALSDNLDLKRPANSCKQVAFAAEVQGNYSEILQNFCQTYTPCRHQSLNYCNGNNFWRWLWFKV